jgi:hypothetical protein
MDFAYISDFKLAMISDNILFFHSIKENEYNIKIKYLRNNLIIANKYLILAGIIYITFPKIN